jgi:hypothetical protein
MAHDAAVSLLNLSTKAGKPRRSMYAFFYATIACMTTIFMGYSTYPSPTSTSLSTDHGFCT